MHRTLYRRPIPIQPSVSRFFGCDTPQCHDSSVRTLNQLVPILSLATPDKSCAKCSISVHTTYTTHGLDLNLGVDTFVKKRKIDLGPPSLSVSRFIQSEYICFWEVLKASRRRQKKDKRSVNI